MTFRTASLVIHPDVSGNHGGTALSRSPEACLEEAEGLAQAIDLDIVQSEIIKIRNIKPGTLFGAGTVERLRDAVAEQKVELVIVNHALSPVQQRNLERAWGAKVIDRTGLILEIFGARAQTNEGKLQVELAALSYQRSRLVRAWTHLERQRGGFGFTGGPGETQIELDRRMLDERIERIKTDLEKVRQTRKLQRRSRERVPYPIVALVGYTNAGKSTLFNRLTNADVFAKDLLFATLDPTMRALDLPSGQTVILSDTVGFISELPTHLIAAFRATLEEVEQASVILHIRDISHDFSEAEKEDVDEILKSLGIDPEKDERVIEVLNKIDLLEDRPAQNRKVAVSAITGEGVDDLLTVVDQKIGQNRKIHEIHLAPVEGEALAWLYEHSHVINRVDSDDEIRLECDMDTVQHNRFKSRFGHA